MMSVGWRACMRKLTGHGFGTGLGHVRPDLVRRGVELMQQCGLETSVDRVFQSGGSVGNGRADVGGWHQ